MSRPAANAAHPRSRGENMKPNDLTPVQQGSSPLTRGKLEVGDVRTQGDRLIPAHAGKTWTRPPPSRPCAAHPRSRGENEIGGGLSAHQFGSSPLTRGKLVPCHAPPSPYRLIPAHAGKTAFHPAIGYTQTAHPRSRGENALGERLDDLVCGSSPLTRGKHHRRDHRRDVHGLIPAHAGKTLSRGRPMASPGAHPRSRGENPSAWTRSESVPGSSPLTRGKRGSTVRWSRVPRLIPAHAGKT